ncbi:hypothetical protein CMI37_24065 [Candidatus Pacearchaeota archaeon]|nr:hypothetical protein [Candidatus Pacearchaeota archaeon]|tara:strand:- start:837 stop:1106 length:270 start_codon:yes stop_codon:yes gene_type:complete
MGLFRKGKTRNNLAKHDLESVHTALEYINTSASTVASMAAKYHKRYLMEGCEGDNDFMAICDTTTTALKEAYEILYQIVNNKQQEIAKE